MSEQHLRRNLYITALIAVCVPPFVGGTLLAVVGLFPFPDFYRVFYSYSGLYTLAVAAFSLWFCNRAVQYIAELPLLPREEALRRLDHVVKHAHRHIVGFVVLYSIFGGLSANYSLVQLGVHAGYTVAQQTVTVLATAPMILATVFPLVLRVSDILGRYLGPRGLVVPVFPLRSKLLMLGIVGPALVDTLLLVYYSERDASIDPKALLLWAGLLLIGVIGFGLVWASIRQSLAPLQEFIGAPVDAERARRTLVPESLDELGIVAQTLRQRIEEQESLRLKATRAEQLAQQLREIFEVAPDLIGSTDADGRLIHMNAGGRRLLGIGPDEDITPLHIADCHPPETAARLLNEVFPWCMKHGSWQGETIFRRRDGSTFTASQVVMAHRDAQGRLLRLSTIARDMTERLAAEAARRRSEGRLQQVLRLQGLGIFEHDHRTEAIYASPEQRRLYGLSEDEEATLEKFFARIHPEDLPRVPSAVARAHNPSGDGRFDVEFRIVGHDGSVCWLNYRSQTIFEGEGTERRPVLTVGVAIDVHERKQTEEALRRSETRLLEAQQIARLGSWELDLRGNSNELHWSDEMFRIFEIEKERFVVSFDEFSQDVHPAFLQAVHPEDRDLVIRASKVSKRSNTRFALVHRLLMPDGRIKHVQAQGETEYDKDGQALRAVGTVQDITALREAQQALEQLNRDLEARVAMRTEELAATNRELAAFSYSVSHDLRTPLRGIDGYSRLLERDYAAVLDDKARSYVERVRAGTQRMGAIIDDMLSLSRVTRVEFKPASLDLSAMAREVARELQNSGTTRSVEWRIADGLTAAGDPGMIRLVLENLLGNAWKYTGKTSEAVIEFASVGVRDGMREFCVRDNGAGFDMTYGDKLFQPFKRLHGQHEFEGQGIGLATVQRAIARHGGTVRAEGAVGKGAAFYFSLPVRGSINS